MKQIIFALVLILGFGFSAFSQSSLSNCAEIKVTGGGVVKAGDPMNFTAEVTGKTKTFIEYEWKISAGTIASGQGTPSITIDIIGLEGGTNVTAEVKIKGLYDNCANTASEIGSVMELPICRCVLDKFGKLSDNEVKARISNLYVTLDYEINAQGYIINYGTEKEIANRERQIRKAISFLKYNSYRITLINGGENPDGAGVLTKVFVVPPGAETPQP